jgi:chemotaxis protein CheX
LKANYINAFLEPAVQIIEKILQVKAGIGWIKRGEIVDLEESIAVVISVNGDLNGAVIMSFSKDTAKRIVEDLLKKDNVTEFTQAAKDVLSELANMIVGNVSGRLYEMGLNEDLAPPVLVVGSSTDLSIPDIDNPVKIPINTELGTIDLNILLRDDRSP